MLREHKELSDAEHDDHRPHNEPHAASFDREHARSHDESDPGDAPQARVDDVVENEHAADLIPGTLHTNKTNSNDPRQRGVGSVGWRQVARAVGLDPGDLTGDKGRTRCIAHDKHNLGPWTPTLRAEPLPLGAISAQLGHASIATTSLYVAKLTASDLAEQMASIGRTFTAAPTG